MANSLSISDEEFANAILQARPDNKSITEYLDLITICAAPDEEQDDWQRVCVNIRIAKNIPTITRDWCNEAHRIFTDNLVPIERRIMNKIMDASLADTNTMDIVEAVNAVIDRYHGELESAPKNLQNNKFTAFFKR